MSPTLTDAHLATREPSDGIAALEGRGSVAETFGIPLAVLAELTHRCPLLLQSGRAGARRQRIDHRGMEKGSN
jgi:hypothetical protein